MKKLFYFLIFISTGLPFSCSTQSSNDPLLLSIMENRMNAAGHKKYSPVRSEDTLKFITDENGFFLQGNLKEVNNFKDVTLLEADNDSSRYYTALFEDKGGIWQSVFKNELEEGILDTIIDLNNDKMDEILLQAIESNKAGWESELVIYSKRDSMNYIRIGSVAPRYLRRTVNTEASSTIEFMQKNDDILLSVSTMKTSYSDNNIPDQIIDRLIYYISASGGLHEFASNIISLNPLIFYCKLDGLWGICERYGDTVLIKGDKLWKVNEMDKVFSKIREVIPPIYQVILYQSEGLFPVSDNEDHWGFSKANGELVIPCKYDGVSYFKNGRAVVRIPGEEDWRNAFRCVDTTGKDLGLYFVQGVGNDSIVTVFRNSFQEEYLQNYPSGEMHFSFNDGLE